jgi:hypothetical protein
MSRPCKVDAIYYLLAVRPHLRNTWSESLLQKRQAGSGISAQHTSPWRVSRGGLARPTMRRRYAASKHWQRQSSTQGNCRRRFEPDSLWCRNHEVRCLSAERHAVRVFCLRGCSTEYEDLQTWLGVSMYARVASPGCGITFRSLSEWSARRGVVLGGLKGLRRTRMRRNRSNGAEEAHLGRTQRDASGNTA